MSFRQKGGSIKQDLLETFLESRGENYQKEMSSPVSAEYVVSSSLILLMGLFHYDRLFS